MTSTDDNDPGDAQSNAINKNNQTSTGDPGSEDKVSRRSLKNRILDFISSTTGIISGVSALLVALAVLIGAVTGLWSKLAQTLSSGSTPKVAQSSSRSPSCPTGLPSWYKQPKTLERPQGVSLVICPIDVNDGRPLSTRLSLSGLILGSVPPGEHLELVSYPDPNTCDVYGNPGTGGYFGLQEIDPSDNNGGWQFTTPKSYPGSETIRRFLYFVLGSESALQSQGACKFGDLRGRFAPGLTAGRVCAGYGVAFLAGGAGLMPGAWWRGFQVTAGLLLGSSGVIRPRSSIGSR